MISESWNLVGESPSTQIKNVTLRKTKLNNEKIYVLQIWASLCYTLGQLFFNYKLRQTLLQIGEALLSQIGACVVTN